MRIVVDLQAAQGASRFRGIGRYSLELALAMARHSGDHEIWIALNGLFPEAADSVRARFDGLVPQQRMVTFSVPKQVEEILPANRWRAQTARKIREQFLASLKPDVVYLSSLFEGYGEDVVTSIGAFDPSLTTAVTCYDLIPLLHPEMFLDDPVLSAWYLRKAQALKLADLLLAISESSRSEAMEALDVPGDRVVNVQGGVDAAFRPVALSREESAQLLRHYGITRPFLMHFGLEPRKNGERLIEALGLLPNSLRDNYQLAIIGRCDSVLRGQMEKAARKAGLRPDTLIFTQQVPDQDLIALYSTCTLFVFPSVHEGFGLPPLEAMACGAPTIASNSTSLPEVMGWTDALFDPLQARAISEKLHQVLSDEQFRIKLREHGLVQSKKFTWEATGRKALSALEELVSRKASQQSSDVAIAPPRRIRPRLAFVSPLPPEGSGIAVYSAELLPELARFYEIEAVVQQPEEVSDSWITANIPVRDVRYFEERISKYDRVVYHMGNSAFHVHMLGMLQRHPGVVVLHDFYLSGLVHHAERANGMTGAFARALYDSHGYSGLLMEKREGREQAAEDVSLQSGGAERRNRSHRAFRLRETIGRAVVWCWKEP